MTKPTTPVRLHTNLDSTSRQRAPLAAIALIDRISSSFFFLDMTDNCYATSDTAFESFAAVFRTVFLPVVYWALIRGSTKA